MFLLAVDATAQSSEGEAISVELKVNGEQVDLSENVRKELRDQADKIARHCGYDSGDRGQQVWHDALAERSSIRLIYAAPVKVRLPRWEILVSEAVFSISDESFLGQPLLHHDGQTTLVVKCDGKAMLVLMCMPELKAYFPPAYQRSCRIIRQD